MPRAWALHEMQPARHTSHVRQAGVGAYEVLLALTSALLFLELLVAAAGADGVAKEESFLPDEAGMVGDGGGGLRG